MKFTDDSGEVDPLSSGGKSQTLDSVGDSASNSVGVEVGDAEEAEAQTSFAGSPGVGSADAEEETIVVPTLNVASHYPSGIEEEEPDFGGADSDPDADEDDEVEEVGREEAPRKGIVILTTPKYQTCED